MRFAHSLALRQIFHVLFFARSKNSIFFLISRKLGAYGLNEIKVHKNEPFYLVSCLSLAAEVC